MRITIVINSTGRGGAERVALTLASWLGQQANTFVSVVALRESTKKTYPIDGCDYINLKNEHNIRGLRQFVKERRADLVLTMDVPLCVYTVPALVGLNVKHIVSERNSPANFAGKWITKVLSRLLMKTADGFVFQTKQAQAYYGGIIAKKSVVIPNPIIDFSDFVPVPAEKREKKIVAVGRLAKQKNYRLLIDAFSSLPDKYSDYKLVIYGDGPERGEIRRRVEEEGLLERVLMPGTSDHVHRDIANAALFVMSSDFEGMPNALMEAMALGLPCVSTDCPCGGPSELIENGVNGLLVPVGNKDAMVTAMVHVLDDTEFASQLSKSAIFIRDAYDKNKICKMWLDYFACFIKSH